MIKKLGLPTLVLGAALGLLNPSVSQAREDENHHHRHRFSVMFGVGPTHYPSGYYDRWGRWHPYSPGYYDRWGYWHPYR